MIQENMKTKDEKGDVPMTTINLKEMNEDATQKMKKSHDCHTLDI